MGSTDFSKFIKDNRKDLILFKATLFAEEAKNDPIKKAELIRDIVQSIGKVPDPIQRSIYTQQCAERFGMQEQILISEVNKVRRARAKEQHKEDIAPHIGAQDLDANAAVHQEQLRPAVQSVEYIERDIVTALMEYGTWEIQLGDDQTESATKFIMEDMEGIEFQSQYKFAYDYIRAEYDAGRIYDPNHYTMSTEPEISALAIRLLTDDSYDEVSPGWWTRFEVVLPDKVRTYQKNIISATMRLKQLKNLETLKQVEDMLRDEKDEEKIMKLMGQHKALMEQKKDFAKATGTVIYRPL
jgi:DNA primase